MFGSREGGAITQLQSQFFNKTEQHKTILQCYPYQKLNFVTLGSSLRTVKEAQGRKFQALVVEAVMASSQACTFSGGVHSPYHTFGTQCFFFSSALLQPLSASCLPQCGILSQPAPSSTFRKGRQNSIKFWGSCSCGCGRFKETDTGKKKKRKKKKPINIEQRTFK